MSEGDLVKRVAQLEALVEDLRRRVERRDSRTMKQTLRCACGGTRILHLREVEEASARGVAPMALAHRFSHWFGDTRYAPLEAYVCRACGLVEWHGTALEELKIDGESVVEIEAPAEAEPGGDPYR